MFKTGVTIIFWCGIFVKILEDFTSANCWIIKLNRKGRVEEESLHTWFVYYVIYSVLQVYAVHDYG